MSGIIENTLLSCSDLDSRVVCKVDLVPPLGNVRKCLITMIKIESYSQDYLETYLLFWTSFPEISNHFANTAYEFGPIVL